MSRKLTALTLAACALSTHCEDEIWWTHRGRTYLARDVTVTRATASADADVFFPVGQGDVIYQASLEVPRGAVPPDALDVVVTVTPSAGPWLEAGDEPLICVDFLGGFWDAREPEHACQAARTGEGQSGVDVWRGDERLAGRWSSLRLPTSTQRVVFEVRRPAGAPPLDGTTWRVTVTDRLCESALKLRDELPGCALGAECSTPDVDFQVDDAGCHWRYKSD
jgi:hypothetical protein